MSSLQTGDLVLVPMGNGIREVGTVLQVNCELDDGTANGVLVKTKVSGYRDVYNLADIEPWQPDEDLPQDQDLPPRRNTRSRLPPKSTHEIRLPITSRNAVTPSPSLLNAVETKEEQDRKPAAKRKRAARKVETETSEGGSEAEVQPATSKKSKKRTTAKKQILLVHPDSDSSESDTNMEDHNVSESESNNDPVNDDVVDGEEKFFTAEYSPSSRATCRRCDEVISKGALRISHVPLFRGKPGFRIYRHLACAIFDANVQSLQDVGGWQTLNQKDQEALALRIEESLKEMQQEEEELQPDELVQESFSGEMRDPPKGLTASLLPFQVEGASWMYCQEVKNPSIRGGILADEMGMVRQLR